MSETKACPFCGQAVITDEDPRDVCECEGAFNYRKHELVFGRLRSAALKLFGENCKDVDVSYEPVTTDQLDGILIAASIVAHNQIDKISMTLESGDSVRISQTGVERTKKIKSTMTQ